MFIKSLKKLFKSDNSELLKIIEMQNAQIKQLSDLVVQNQKAPTALALIDHSRGAASVHATELVAPWDTSRTSIGSISNRNNWSSGLKRFIKTETRFDRVILPENLPIDTTDALLSKELRKLIDDLRASVNGAKFFDICPITEIMERCGCGTKDSRRIMDLLREHHCKNLAEEDLELWEKLPDILNYFFSNGAVPLVWD